MMLFWLVIAVMLLGALAFVVWPLLKPSKMHDPNRASTNIAIYQEQLKDLQLAVNHGALSNEQYQINCEELQHSLLLDTAQKTHGWLEQLPSSYRWFTLIMLGGILPCLAMFAYWQWGNSQGLTKAVILQQQAIAAEKLRAELSTPDQVIAKLKQHLVQNPTSAQGWYLLGRLYMSVQQFPAATAAFAQAQQLQPNNPTILFQYAQALYFKQNSLVGKPTDLLKRLLKLDPHNDLALNLLAVAAYQQHDYQTALNYWEQLLPKYAPDSSDGQALLKAIASAQAALTKSATQKAVINSSHVLKIQ